jgi:hypothetical protein
MERKNLAVRRSDSTKIVMQRNVRVFFLSALFGLSAPEIAELMGMHRRHVTRDIATIRDRFSAADLGIFTAAVGKKARPAIRRRRQPLLDKI